MPGKTNLHVYKDMIDRIFKNVFKEKISGRDQLVFIAYNGDKFIFNHKQDCCEHVRIESIDGDLKSLIEVPLQVAQVTQNKDLDRGTNDHFTFITKLGVVTVNWVGDYFGHQPKSIDCKFIKNKTQGLISEQSF